MLNPHFSPRMNKLVYIYVQNGFVIGNLLLTLLIKRLAVAMVNKTVSIRTRKFDGARRGSPVGDKRKFTAWVKVRLDNNCTTLNLWRSNVRDKRKFTALVKVRFENSCTTLSGEVMSGINANLQLW
jgi:hypothetical protein